MNKNISKAKYTTTIWALNPKFWEILWVLNTIEKEDMGIISTLHSGNVQQLQPLKEEDKDYYISW